MRFLKPTRYPPLLLIFTALFAFTASGDDPRSLRDTHEPMTFQGFRLRSNIAVPVPGIWGPRIVSMGPALFQEIPPCQFISTLESDRYPAPWGGPAFERNESRTYQVVGVMEDGDWKNPCSLVVPSTPSPSQCASTSNSRTATARSTWLPGHGDLPPAYPSSRITRVTWSSRKGR